MLKRLTLKIYGRVQGVAFRYYAREEARKLGIFGFTVNEPEGTVRIVAEGEEEKLKSFMEWCKKGPPQAKVEKVEAEWGEGAGEFDDFLVK